jgi:hypothetical protein
MQEEECASSNQSKTYVRVIVDQSLSSLSLCLSLPGGCEDLEGNACLKGPNRSSCLPPSRSIISAHHRQEEQSRKRGTKTSALATLDQEKAVVL